jgi:hypothetical protein
VNCIIHHDGLVDARGIAHVTALPQAVADHNYLRAGAVFLLGKCPAEQRVHAQHREKVRSHRLPPELFRIAVTWGNTRDVRAAVTDGGHIREDVILSFPIEIVGGRRSVVREADMAGILEHHDDAVGVAIRERAQYDGIERGKNCGIGSDSEGEGADRDGRKGGRLAKEAEAVAKVGKESSHLMRLLELAGEVTHYS